MNLPLHPALLDRSSLPRFWVTRLLEGDGGSQIGPDAAAGFRAVPKTLQPKYFYDERGSKLFDAICRTPEYYQTRTELALLERHGADIVDEASPSGLIELGAGAARKTRALLDHVVDQHPDPRYVPVDISENMLVATARSMLPLYPTLRVHGLVADYDYHMHLLPPGPRRLIAFLGGTIGNFSMPRAIGFLRSIAAGMTDGDRVLIGVDLVKSPRVLHDAYNDAAGLTARFNLNLLRVLNNHLGADFDLSGFEHRAVYRPELSQIEMYLVSRRRQIVDLPAIGQRVCFGAGEHVRTEISRKFTRRSAESLMRAAGLVPRGWYASVDEYFAVIVAATE